MISDDDFDPDAARESQRDSSQDSTAGDAGIHIDCDSCAVRGLACGDCVVTFLLGGPPRGVAIDAEERRALDVLAAGGLVPPLRMVSAVDGPDIAMA
jgi:hypothetical protein